MTEPFGAGGGGDSGGPPVDDERPAERDHPGPAERGRGDRGAPMAHPIEPAADAARRRPSEVRRPLLERIGMAAVAAVLGLLFAGVAVAAYVGGELFLAVMAAIGSLMTLWVGALTLVRG